MRVLVCGSRDLEDYKKVKEVLDACRKNEWPIDCIIHGCAYGTDNLAGVWAQQNEIPMELYPAKWKEHGKSAGHIRNSQMLNEGKPDLVIAFWNGNSKGTKNMIDQATKAGIEVKVVEV